MRYGYYPGCSTKTTGLQYDLSSKAVMKALGHDLVEIDNWNCCGSTATDMVSSLLSTSLAARNLALAEAEQHTQLVAACSGCFLNLFRVERHLQRDRALRRKLGLVLGEVGLSYAGKVKVRHLLEVITSDIGLQQVAARVRKPLDGLKVIPYYGCLVVRPYAEFDGPDLPMSMDHAIAALGAEVMPYLMKTRCCGGVLVTTKKSIGMKLIGDLLLGAQGADCIVTVCPLCQLNLDAYQGDAARALGVRLDIPVLYLTQLIGVAFGLGDADTKLSQNIVAPERALGRYLSHPAPAAL